MDKMNNHAQVLEAAAINPPIFIAAIGYIFIDLSTLKLRKTLKVKLQRKASGSGFLLLRHSLDLS
jgi:hypothetical protein